MMSVLIRSVQGLRARLLLRGDEYVARACSGHGGLGGSVHWPRVATATASAALWSFLPRRARQGRIGNEPGGVYGVGGLRLILYGAQGRWGRSTEASAMASSPR